LKLGLFICEKEGNVTFTSHLTSRFKKRQDAYPTSMMMRCILTFHYWCDNRVATSSRSGSGCEPWINVRKSERDTTHREIKIVLVMSNAWWQMTVLPV